MDEGLGIILVAFGLLIALLMTPCVERVEPGQVAVYESAFSDNVEVWRNTGSDNKWYWQGFGDVTYYRGRGYIDRRYAFMYDDAEHLARIHIEYKTSLVSDQRVLDLHEEGGPSGVVFAAFIESFAEALKQIETETPSLRERIKGGVASEVKGYLTRKLKGRAENIAKRTRFLDWFYETEDSKRVEERTKELMEEKLVEQGFKVKVNITMVKDW